MTQKCPNCEELEKRLEEISEENRRILELYENLSVKSIADRKAWIDRVKDFLKSN